MNTENDEKTIVSVPSELEDLIEGSRILLIRGSGYLGAKERTYLNMTQSEDPEVLERVKDQQSLFEAVLNSSRKRVNFRRKANLPKIWHSRYESANKWTDNNDITHYLFPTTDFLISAISQGLQGIRPKKRVIPVSVKDAQLVALAATHNPNPQRLRDWLNETTSHLYKKHFASDETQAHVLDADKRVWNEIAPQLVEYVHEFSPIIDLERAASLDSPIIFTVPALQKAQEKRMEELREIALNEEIQQSIDYIRNAALAPENKGQYEMKTFYSHMRNVPKETAREYVRTKLRFLRRRDDVEAAKTLSMPLVNLENLLGCNTRKLGRTGGIMLDEVAKIYIEKTQDLSDQDVQVSLDSCNSPFLQRNVPRARDYLKERLGEHLDLGKTRISVEELQLEKAYS